MSPGTKSYNFVRMVSNSWLLKTLRWIRNNNVKNDLYSFKKILVRQLNFKISHLKALPQLIPGRASRIIDWNWKSCGPHSPWAIFGKYFSNWLIIILVKAIMGPSLLARNATQSGASSPQASDALTASNDGYSEVYKQIRNVRTIIRHWCIALSRSLTTRCPR